MNRTNNICLIDDDQTFLFAAKQLLKIEKKCNNFTICEDGEKAITVIKKLIKENTLPDIIFLDINMPIQDGWDFLNELDHVIEQNKIPVHILTSSIDPSDIEKSKNYKSVKSFISKPLTTKKIKEI